MTSVFPTAINISPTRSSVPVLQNIYWATPLFTVMAHLTLIARKVSSLACLHLLVFDWWSCVATVWAGQWEEKRYSYPRPRAAAKLCLDWLHPGQIHTHVYGCIWLSRSIRVSSQAHGCEGTGILMRLEMLSLTGMTARSWLSCALLKTCQSCWRWFSTSGSRGCSNLSGVAREVLACDLWHGEVRDMVCFLI